VTVSKTTGNSQSGRPDSRSGIPGNFMISDTGQGRQTLCSGPPGIPGNSAALIPGREFPGISWFQTVDTEIPYFSVL